jgi:hypothetical protein
MCPSLTQAMHDAEQAFSLPPQSLAEESSESAFDWDRAISPSLSTRTRAALRLKLRAIDEYGSVGRPIWPLYASFAHWHFLAGTSVNSLPPVASGLVNVTPLGWGL